MRIRLDDTLLEVSAESVAEAIVIGRNAAEDRRRLVIEVHGDGVPLPAAMLDDPPSNDGGFAEIHLLSTPPGPFIQTTLLDAADLLRQVASDQSEAVRLLHAGHVEEAFGPLQRALTAWAIVRDVVDKSATLGAIDPSSVQVERLDGARESGASHIDALAQHLTEVKRALSIQDFSALADVLAGELHADTTAWVDFLSALADQASRSGD